MKPIKLILAAGIGAAMLSSCGDSSYEVHQTMFYPNKGAIAFFADQVQDTIHVYSLDSWTAQASYLNGGTWFTFTPNKMDVPAGKASDTKLTLFTEANTTGKNLAGTLSIFSHDQISTNVYHYSWLNVISPEGKYVDNNNVSQNTSQLPIEEFETIKPQFAIENIQAAATDTAVRFRVYQAGATLTSDAEWLKLDNSTGIFGVSGEYRVALKAEENKTGETRKANLTLTSAGISTVISVSQKAAQ